MELEKIREEIDGIDEKLCGLFLRRMELGKEAMLEKKRLGRPLVDEEREQRILESVSERSGSVSAYARSLFREMISLSRFYQRACSLLSENCGSLFSPEVHGRLREIGAGEEAFIYTLSLAGINIREKKVLILGGGAASLTVKAAAERLGASRVTVLSRSGGADYGRPGAFADSGIIVNTTSVGMYPDNLNSIIDLGYYKECSGVIDLIYNPRRTVLLMDAQKRGITCIDGLPMLVFQAARAEELASGKAVAESRIAETIGRLREESGNIVVIGMPGSGKSSVAEMICAKMRRPFINIDSEIVKTAGKTIPEIFAQDGEAVFRDIERSETAKAGRLTGAVIATGGGVVKDLRNYAPLHQNGRIYYLRRNLVELETEGRPLSKNFETLVRLQEEREPLYRFFADAEIQNDLSLEKAAKRIMEEYRENICY